MITLLLNVYIPRKLNVRLPFVGQPMISKRFKRVLKKRADHKRKFLENQEIAKLQPFVSGLIEKLDPAEVTNPLHYMNLMFEMFMTIPSKLKKIKWTEEEDSSVAKFSQMLIEFKRGTSPVSAQQSMEILGVCNTFMADEREYPGHFLTDVGLHFRACSSFARKGRLLYTAVRFFRPASVLELGTAYGMSAMFMMLAMERYAKSGQLWTIETNETRFSLAKDVLSNRFGNRVFCYKGRSDEGIPEACRSAPKFGLVFHDGGHSKEDYIRDFRSMSDHLEEGAIILFDDIKWVDYRFAREDPRCYEGWIAIVSDSRVRLAVEVNDSMGVALIGP